MRYLVLSDLHANLAALEAVLADAEGSHDAVLVLGDLVGYGPRPNEVVERIRGLPQVRVVRGNHDRVACGLDEPEGFNAAARWVAEWTRGELGAENRAWLHGLPRGPLEQPEGIAIAHGSPADEDEYIFLENQALRALSACSGQVVLFGHTHLPLVLKADERGLEGGIARGPLTVDLGPLGADGPRWLVNPGAVGQPRDGNPAAAWALVDARGGSLQLRRTDYALSRTQREMTERGFPDSLIWRLGQGC